MSNSKEEERDSNINRRKFIGAGLTLGVAAALGATGETVAASPFSAPASKPDELEETTIADLQEGMRGGKWSAREIAEKYIERIERFDRKGPALNSVIELNPDAPSIAAALDRERKAGRVRSPLHGVPVLIKDNIDTADRMQTTAGSLALVGAPAPRDAFIVTRLREAGAVILGKTNLSEWANFRSTHSSSGWSGRGGQTRNPYAIDRNPCGSSSGSGVAVAANFAAVAVGTETDGSIVCPSSASSLVGIKPTLGLVSRSGIIPIAHSQDTAGPMTRNLADACLLLGALAGIDPRDRATQTSRGKAHADYTRFLDPAGLRGARIGVARKFFGFSDRVDKLMSDAIDALKGAGATLIDPADLPSHGKYDASEFEVLLYEFKADINKYLAERGAGVPRSLKELIEFNERNREREMPYFGQEIFLKAQAKGALTDKAYLAALAKNHRLSRAEGIDAVMTKHRLDAIIAPTGGPPWTTDLVNGDHFSGGSSTPAAVAGYPNINVPAGYVYGLPVGISFFGRAYSEPVLIRLAYAFEQATKHRRPPQFAGTADLRD
ncbi:MAG TPA: amidase [Pyrinomonadaceae bacterium]|nr:amidase [Pyrinomonadaceae bacterium]